jgi:hypothetical protein
MAGNRAIRIVKLIIIGILAIFIFAVGFGEAVLHLWNWLMPALFGLHPITYWQALGLLILCWILFGGQRGFMGRGMHRRRHMGERWQKMTPEEREKFRARMRAWCGDVAPDVAERKS